MIAIADTEPSSKVYFSPLIFSKNLLLELKNPDPDIDWNRGHRLRRFRNLRSSIINRHLLI